MSETFHLHSNYKPSGDQPNAIQELVNGVKEGKRHQTLLGATGTGKTFTISNVIKEVNKPTLVMAHNKTLAGQLYNEFKEFFPNNAVEYFVSYYDYYQPEAYVPQTDTYIEKDSSINDEIDELRHSATSALISRGDVIVVASVSCIYGIGEPEEYKNNMFLRVPIARGETLSSLNWNERFDFLKKEFENNLELCNLFEQLVLAATDNMCISQHEYFNTVKKLNEYNQTCHKLMANGKVNRQQKKKTQVIVESKFKEINVKDFL